MHDRPEELAQVLSAGVPTAVLWRQLDSLLIWLGNPDNPRVAALDRAICGCGLTRLAASGRAYDLLDRMLFAEASARPERFLGLTDQVDAASAKQRYRRLIQAYHPDRHPARAREFTERLEQINIAFATLGQEKGRVAAGEVPPFTNAAPPVRPRAAGRYSRGSSRKSRAAARRPFRFGAYAAQWLRSVFGNAASFESRFFAVLLVVCAVMLGSLVYQSVTPMKAPLPDSALSVADDDGHGEAPGQGLSPRIRNPETIPAGQDRPPSTSPPQTPEAGLPR